MPKLEAPNVVGCSKSRDSVVAKNNLKLSTLDLKRRIFIRTLGVTYPYWGLACVGMINDLFNRIASRQLFGDWKDIFLIFAPICLLAGYTFSFRLLFSALELTPEKLIFPGWLKKAYPGKFLNSLVCVDSGSSSMLEFNFQDENAQTSTERVPLQRLSYSDRLALLNFIEKHFPNTKIDGESRQLIEKPEQVEFIAGSELSVPYNGHFRFKSFLQTCLEVERHFWTAWLLVCIPIAIFLMPLLALGPVNLFLKSSNKSTMAVDQLWSQWSMIWVNHFGELLRVFERGVMAWGDVFNRNEALALTVDLIAFGIFAKWIVSAIKPAFITVGPSEFRLVFLQIGGYRLCRKVALKDCKKAKIESDTKSVAKSKLRLEDEKGAELISFELAGIDKQKHRAEIYKALEFYAPHVELDPNFIESVQRNQNQSCTELWLQSLSTPPKRDRLSPLKGGDHLQGGNFRILDIVGSGGQGIAYLSEQEGQAETVVVKEFILPVFVDRRARQQALERFENEAKLLYSICHPNVVSLKAHFIEDHRAYLVLERVNGKSLRKLFSESPIRDEKALNNIVNQMVEILRYLHSLAPPLVHRDFTPDNLILDESGVLKLIDFNVARQSEGKSRTAVVGKHAYMPPEQFAGKPRPQSDLYALGATLFFCLRGEDPEPFTQSLLPDLGSDFSGLWHEIVWNCTALALADRVASAADLAQLLESYSTKTDMDTSNSSSNDLDEPESISIAIEEIEQIHG